MDNVTNISTVYANILTNLGWRGGEKVEGGEGGGIKKQTKETETDREAEVAEKDR